MAKISDLSDLVSDGCNHREKAEMWAGGLAGHHQDLLHIPGRQLGLQTGPGRRGLQQVRNSGRHPALIDKCFGFGLEIVVVKIIMNIYRESVRFVAHEVGQPRVQCSEKELGTDQSTFDNDAIIYFGRDHL